MTQHTISLKTIIKVFVVPLAAYVFWINKDILLSLFMAFILMSALRPAVRYLYFNRKVPPTISAAIVVLCAIVVLVFVVGSILPPIIIETSVFIEKLPDTLKALSPTVSQYVAISDISQYLPTAADKVVSIIGNVFSNTFLVLLSLFVTYYLLAQERVLDERIHNILGRHLNGSRVKNTIKIIHAAQARLASWFWGELLLMLVVGLISYIGFSWIGIKYALPLAVLAGFLEAVPNIGPIISAAIATLVGFTQGTLVGLGSLAVSVVVQQLENYLLVPYIMKKAVGLNPIITMLSIVVGMRVAGPVGALLAIPTYVLIESIYREVYPLQKSDPEIMQ